jgi:hypothetical protein
LHRKTSDQLRLAGLLMGLRAADRGDVLLDLNSSALADAPAKAGCTTASCAFNSRCCAVIRATRSFEICS